MLKAQVVRCREFLGIPRPQCSSATKCINTSAIDLLLGHERLAQNLNCLQMTVGSQQELISLHLVIYKGNI